VAEQYPIICEQLPVFERRTLAWEYANAGPDFRVRRIDYLRAVIGVQRLLKAFEVMQADALVDSGVHTRRSRASAR
jgi:hypothetical protein